ncbi:MAG TPA: glycosyltransferase family 2 protein [Pirellulales bacterium]
MQACKRTDGISICIPNWNHRSYLYRSVGCALATARELARHGLGCEVLVIDDASRDGSQRLLLRLAMMDATGSLQIIANDENRGLGAARNRGLRESRYKWVCFLDADNELIPENVFHFYRAAKDTGAAFTYGNLVVRIGGPDGPVSEIISNDFLNESIFERNYIDAMAVVDADQALAVGGYVESRTMPEDLEFVLHMAAEGRQIVMLPMLLGHWYLHKQSLGQDRGAVDNPKIDRIFNQRKAGLPLGFKPRMYHPDVGYLV